MYKASQDKLDFQKRVASHATKPSRRGIIRDIPAWAREPEDYYNSLLEQYDAETTRLHALRERVIWLRQQLKNRLPFTEYERLKHELDFAGPELSDLEQSLGHLKTLARAAAQNAWGIVFYLLAEQRLDTKIFTEINTAVQELLNRQQQELRAGRSEKTEQQRRRLNRRTRLQHRRTAVRDALARGTYRTHQ